MTIQYNDGTVRLIGTRDGVIVEYLFPGNTTGYIQELGWLNLTNTELLGPNLSAIVEIAVQIGYELGAADAEVIDE